MGLGSSDNIRRKEVKAVLPKNDWKAKIRGSTEAIESIAAINRTRPQFPDGSYLKDTYAELKITQLGAYAAYCSKVEQRNETPVTLKEFLNGQKKV